MSLYAANKTLFAIMLVTLLGVAGIALPYPIFAPLFSGHTESSLASFAGLSPNTLFAMVLSAYPLGMFVGSSIIGPLSDSYGRRKTLVISTIFSATSYLLSALAIAQESFLLLLVSRLLTGLCEGNIAIGRAILTDLSGQIDKTRAFSLLYATSYAGWLLGPLIGGYSVEFGYETAFYIASALTYLSLIAIVLFIPETSPEHLHLSTQSFLYQLKHNHSWSLLSHQKVGQFFTMYLLLTTGLTIFYQYFPMWLSSVFSFDSEGLAGMTVTQTVAMIIFSTIVVTQLKKVFSTMTIISTGVITLSVLLFSIPLIEQSWLIVFFFSTGAAIATYNGLIPVIASDMFNQVPQGKLMGLLTSTYCLSGVVAALFAGAVSQLSVMMSIQLGGVLLLVALAMLIKLMKTPETSGVDSAILKSVA